MESILAQTFTDFEFLIIDDGSTDGTAAILQRLARQDDRIRLIRQANAGVSAASNLGLAMAQGEFFARMDHDDIASPRRLELQVEFLRAHPECVAVGGQALMIDSEGFPIRIPRVPLTHEEIETAFTQEWAIFHPTFTARAQAMRDVGGYSLEHKSLEDLDMFIKLAERGRLANLPDVLVQYRQHFKSICFTQYRDQIVQLAGVFRDAAKRRGKSLTDQYENLGQTLREPPPPRLTRWSYEKMWAWWALAAGYVTTSRRHALRAFRLRPLQPETWLLLWCALRGY